MSAPVNNEYYIVVKKDGGKFTIEDTIPQSPNTLDKRNPTDIIIQPDSAVVYFPIKVTKTTSSGSTPPNSFDVNGITYTLILDTAIVPDINNKDLIINENNFATFTSPAVQPGNNNNNNSNNINNTSNNTNSNNSNSSASNTHSSTSTSTSASTISPSANASGSTNNSNTNLNNDGNIDLSGGKKQKQRRSKRNYSKKQRKQWAKNNTLRNYFNYRESAP